MGTEPLGRPRSLWDTTFQFNPANFVAALICGLLVAGLAAALVLTRPAKYESTATIAVDQPAAIASGGDRVIDKLQRIGQTTPSPPLFHMELSMVGAGLLLALTAGLVAGIYPAWRICRIAPALHLKQQ